MLNTFLGGTLQYQEERLNQICSSTFNNFHKNINFIFEEEIDGKIPFLDALLVRNNHYIVTTVYRKKIYIYLNWNSFGPNSWKWSTLITIVTRAFEICSTDKFLEEEIEYITTVFYHQKKLHSLGN